MKISSIPTPAFKGYDARPLKGLLVGTNVKGIADELSVIGKKEGFSIYSLRGTTSGYKCVESAPSVCNKYKDMWAQDIWTILHGKIIARSFDEKTMTISKFFSLKPDLTQYIERTGREYENISRKLYGIYSPKTDSADKNRGILEAEEDLYRKNRDTHIPGGNIFILKGENGNEIIVGEDELNKFPEDEIKSMYQAAKITVLPQMDYHLDLFIRPLDKKRILLADDKLTLEVLNSGKERLKKYLHTSGLFTKIKYMPLQNRFDYVIKAFMLSIRDNKLPKADNIEEILTSSGYEVIRVPGRIYDTDIYKYPDKEEEPVLRHLCNYMNAQVLINDKNDIVYITNEAKVDKDLGVDEIIAREIGFSFKDAFVRIISKYINPEHIYFVKGEKNYVAEEMMYNLLGGIHCVATEIPQGELSAGYN